MMDLFCGQLAEIWGQTTTFNLMNRLEPLGVDKKGGGVGGGRGIIVGPKPAACQNMD